jgi:hypothetical protein
MARTECPQTLPPIVIEEHRMRGNDYTAKKIIGNRWPSLKSASLLIKNIISSIGIFFATHKVLFYIKDSKKIFQLSRWVKIPWYLMENSAHPL